MRSLRRKNLRANWKRLRRAYLVVDNYGAHKTLEVKRWLAQHPRFKLHFTPTSASWLNMIELFFAELSRRSIKLGTFVSVKELVAAFKEHIELHNKHPKPFEWHATADEILGKDARCKEALDTGH